MAQKPPLDKNTLAYRVRNPEYTEPTPPTPPNAKELAQIRADYRQLVNTIIEEWQDTVPVIHYRDIYFETRKRGFNTKWIRTEIAWLISQVDKYLNPDDFVIESPEEE